MLGQLWEDGGRLPDELAHASTAVEGQCLTA